MGAVSCKGLNVKCIFQPFYDEAGSSKVYLYSPPLTKPNRRVLLLLCFRHLLSEALAPCLDWLGVFVSLGPGAAQETDEEITFPLCTQSTLLGVPRLHRAEQHDGNTTDDACPYLQYGLERRHRRRFRS